MSARLQVAPLAKMLLVGVFCLLAISIIKQACSGLEGGPSGGLDGIEAARIGFIRAGDQLDPIRLQLEPRNSITQKRFFIQGQPSETMSLEDISSVDLNFNNNKAADSAKSGSNKGTRGGNDSDDDDDNQKDDDDDDDDGDSDDEDNKSGDRKQGKSKQQQQQAASEPADGATDQLVAAANGTAGAGGASGGGSQAPAKPKPAESQRPRLFKMGLLIG